MKHEKKIRSNYSEIGTFSSQPKKAPMEKSTASRKRKPERALRLLLLHLAAAVAAARRARVLHVHDDALDGGVAERFERKDA